MFFKKLVDSNCRSCLPQCAATVSPQLFKNSYLDFLLWLSRVCPCVCIAKRLANGCLEAVLEYLQPVKLSPSAGGLFVFWGACSKFRLFLSLPPLFLLCLL